jgi:hypothetical protein
MSAIISNVLHHISVDSRGTTNGVSAFLNSVEPCSCVIELLLLTFQFLRLLQSRVNPLLSAAPVLMVAAPAADARITEPPPS